MQLILTKCAFLFGGVFYRFIFRTFCMIYISELSTGRPCLIQRVRTVYLKARDWGRLKLNKLSSKYMAVSKNVCPNSARWKYNAVNEKVFYWLWECWALISKAPSWTYFVLKGWIKFMILALALCEKYDVLVRLNLFPDFCSYSFFTILWVWLILS